METWEVRSVYSLDMVTVKMIVGLPCSTICFADAASRPSLMSFLSSSVPRPSGKGGSLDSRAAHSALGVVYAVKSIWSSFVQSLLVRQCEIYDCLLFRLTVDIVCISGEYPAFSEGEKRFGIRRKCRAGATFLLG